MAAEQVIDAAVIKRTQDTLGKFVKKPPLTEKLLRKPPFRFLHDVFNVVIKDTGYFAGLYTPDELVFENIKDRDDKMGYLKKMIEVVKIITNSPTTVRASKIVCGHEPEKTNELLQLIGEVIEKQLDWRSAVEQVVNNNNNNLLTGNNTDRADVEENPVKTELKKAEEKPKETKPKDKVKAKEKDKASKDAKTKDRPPGKNISPNGKNISPTGKEQKTRKGSLTAGKDTPTSKTPKMKDNKTPKDGNKTATDKPKLSKTKLDSKSGGSSSKTPSPSVPNATPTKEPPPPPAALPVEQPKAARPADVEKQVKANEPKLKGKPIEAIVPEPMNEQVTANGRLTADSPKPLDKEEPPPTTLTGLTNGEIEPRKLSASQRKGSGNSRRSSGHKARRERDHAAELVHETPPSPAVEKPTMVTAPAPPQPRREPSTAEESMKRESTFTRDDSKDSAISMTTTTTAAARPRTSLRPPSARPASARPGAPRKRNKNVEIILQPNDEVKLTGGIKVKLQTFGDFAGNDDDDDADNLVVIEDGNADALEDNLIGMRPGETASMLTGTTGAAEMTGDGGQGHLVQQILDTQKELVQTSGDATGKRDGRQTSASNRQSSGRQVDNLRDVIQNLTKSVNPFGKLMDFIPEDIDAMQLEVSMWREAYAQAAAELKREQSLTESVTEPMKHQLVQIDGSIKEMRDMIDASRMKTLQNADKILKMLTTD